VNQSESRRRKFYEPIILERKTGRRERKSLNVSAKDGKGETPNGDQLKGKLRTSHKTGALHRRD